MVCRYKSMCGFYVPRKGGWDTHGLPVEIAVERELGINGKDQIEKFGIAEFNRRCRESVLRYEAEWRRITERIGYWLDMNNRTSRSTTATCRRSCCCRARTWYQD